MKILTSIAILVTAASLTACAARNSSPDMQIKPKVAPAVMKPAPVDASCHSHSSNSVTKSSKHCHKAPAANHSHKYSGK